MDTMQFTTEQIDALLAALGLPDDTDDPQVVVLTAVDMAAQLGDPAAVKTIAASAKRAGLEVLELETAAALRRDAAEGRRVAAAAAKAKVEASVGTAVDRGKITPSRRKHWVTLLENDPGMAEVLAAIPDECAIPMSEVGHAADVHAAAGADDDGAWFW